MVTVAARTPSLEACQCDSSRSSNVFAALVNLRLARLLGTSYSFEFFMHFPKKHARGFESAK